MIVHKYDVSITMPGNYVVNDAHDKNSPKYNPIKSVLQANHEDLWKKRTFEEGVDYWTIEFDERGRDYTLHRFQKDSNGDYHWNGSSKGETKSGKPYTLPKIPNGLIKLAKEMKRENYETMQQQK